MAPATQPNEPATPLKRLHRDRAGVASDLATLNASSARLRQTVASETAVLQEIGEMGSVEIAAMTAWASGGCVGEPPAPDLTQRRVLAERLSVAQSAAAAAKGAGEDINHRIGELNQQLISVNERIEVAALDALQAEFGIIFDQHRVAVENTRVLTAKLAGLARYFADQGREQIDVRNNGEAGRRYFVRGEALAINRLTDPGITHVEILEAVAFWAARYAALRKGA